MWWLLGSLALGATCDLASPYDAPFEVQRTRAERASLLVELWVRDDDTIPWARDVLAVMKDRDLAATVVVPLGDAPSPAVRAFLTEAQGAGHGVALLLAARDVPTDVLEPVRPLKKKIKAFESTSRIRSSASPIGGRGSEALLGKAGFRMLLQTQAAAGATPRLAGQFEGQPRVNVVVPPGAYEGPCGPTAVVGPFTPRAADRAMQAVVKGLSEETPTPITRVALDGARGSDHDAEVLGRWLDEVVLPASVQVTIPDTLRPKVLQGFKTGPVSNEERRASGRLVPIETVMAAVEELQGIDELPLAFETELNPTELFVALLLVVTDETESGSVHLRTLSGPVSQPEVRSDPVTVDPDAVRTVARQLLAALPAELPAALPVDGQLLSAAEFLMALASVARGDERATAPPVASPDPHARGLGWGRSE